MSKRGGKQDFRGGLASQGGGDALHSPRNCCSAGGGERGGREASRCPVGVEAKGAVIRGRGSMRGEVEPRETI